MKGLPVYIYRSKLGDCSNGGISSYCAEAILVGPGVPEIFEESPKTPAVKIVTRNLGGKFGVYHHAEPFDPVSEGLVGWMAGGCFVYSSDSRFPFSGPIALHDRSEEARS